MSPFDGGSAPVTNVLPMTRFGETELPSLGLGCNNFGEIVNAAEAATLVAAALDAGIVYFDTADAYPPSSAGTSETLLGAALVGRRSEAFVATKFGYNFGAPEGRGDAAFVRQSVEASLGRLQTDHIDLLYYHRFDSKVPMVETIGAMAELVERGLVRYLGCSNLTPTQMSGLAEVAAEVGTPLVAVQGEFSVLRDVEGSELLPVCDATGIKLVPFFTLACGLLTGKFRAGLPLPSPTRLEDRSGRYNRFVPEEQMGAVEALAEYATARGHTLLELALGWVRGHDNVGVVLAGARNERQLADNIAAFAAWDLDQAELSEAASLVSRSR